MCKPNRNEDMLQWRVFPLRNKTGHNFGLQVLSNPKAITTYHFLSAYFTHANNM